MKDFQYYYDCFSNLHTAKARRFPAPHKPLLLLSVIELVERGVITSNKIELTDTLIRTFKGFANKFIGHSIIFRPNIGQPYYHLQFEPFWSLIPRQQAQELPLAAEGVGVYGAKKAVYSIKGLREQYKYALIDQELFDLLQNADVRATLRTLLISRYLSQQPNTVSPLNLLPLAVALSLIA